MIAAPPAPKKAAPAGQHTQAAVRPNDFGKAAKQTTESFLDLTSTCKSSSTRIPQIDVPANGWLRHVVLTFHCDAPAGATGLVADAPWSLVEKIAFSDVNGASLLDLQGFDAMLSNFVGAYVQHADPRKLSTYKASVADGITFTLRIPLEIVSRAALGVLENDNSAQQYKVNVTIASRDDVWVGATADAAVTVTGILEGYSKPAPTDLLGVPNQTEPPAKGVTQNWSENTQQIGVGKNTLRLPRVGNAIRNLVFVLRDSTGARTDQWPTEMTLLIDGKTWHQVNPAYFQQRAQELYGWGASDLLTGVLVLPFSDDYDGTPGEEVGDRWIVTGGGTRFELQFISPIAGNITTLTNDVLAIAAEGGQGATLGAQA